SKPITQVYLWITDPNSDEPAILLDDAGFTLPAAAVRGVVNAPDKQRAGVYGTAQQLVSFLTNAEATRWVTPQPGKPQFDPDAFANSTDTLYSLSKEGRGNAGPLVTALTVAVCEAAEQTAKSLPGGRLGTPMVAVLDEAANVCRWNELPNLYSHYGSRGICVLTFLQSWSQGVEVWGREGMRKLWSASTVKVYGGGVSEVEFLDELSRLIGETEFVDVSTSYNGRGHGRSTSRQRRRERILDVADLGALDRGRVIVLAAGARPLLGRTQPWWDSARADEISASLRRHDPATAPAERNYTAIEEL
ncbi:type IV secretory system conjugative DNA transfer family protein, partial [uncultured Aeromicrobium sp.]|uniref:type IV secretory system conjugative DNA transfer family protein n=1 Tax=uncultured Aeromicrobium sp. TaxID=337820 RepID=UPI0025E701F4